MITTTMIPISLLHSTGTESSLLPLYYLLCCFIGIIHQNEYPLYLSYD